MHRLAPLRFTAAALSVHKAIVPAEQLHILLQWSLVAIHSQAPPTSAINSDSPELKQWGFLHYAERSGTARATESALPCVRRVTIVLHRFVAQVFEIVVTCCVNGQHERGSFPTTQRMIRSEYIDLLRTRLGCVDRGFSIFIRRIKLLGGYHLAHADLSHVRTVFPPGQAPLIAAHCLAFAGMILESARNDVRYMLITHLAVQLEAIVRMLSGRHQVLKPPVHFDISSSASLTGTIVKPVTWTVCDTQREFLGGLMTSQLATSSPATARARHRPPGLEPWPALHAYPSGS